MSEEKASAIRTQPAAMEVSAYTLKQLKQEAINTYFEHLIQSGAVSMYLDVQEVDGVSKIKVSIHENLYV